MDIAAANAGISLNVTYEIDAHDLVREIVLAGVAHTVMCASAMQSEIEQGELVATLLTPKVSTRLLCGTPSNRPVSAASRLIISLIKATLAETAGQRSGDISIDYGGNLSA
jgi:LysR family nitrogen assimilation transcriptional regulator